MCMRLVPAASLEERVLPLEFILGEVVTREWALWQLIKQKLKDSDSLESSKEFSDLVMR